MKINLYKDCSTTPISYTVNPVPISSVLLNLTNFFATTATGVYEVELYIKKEDGDIYRESNCRYLDCDDTKCSVYEGFPNNVDKVIAYNALTASNTCENCSCKNMCLINQTITTNDRCDTSCMCSEQSCV